MQVGDVAQARTQVCCFTNPLRPPPAATSPAGAGEDLRLGVDLPRLETGGVAGRRPVEGGWLTTKGVVMQVGDVAQARTQVCCFTNPLRPPLAALSVDKTTSPAGAGEDCAQVEPINGTLLRPGRSRKPQF